MSPALAVGAHQGIEHPLLGGQMRLGLHDLAPPVLLDEADPDLDQVAHDLLHVAADIADLGELGRLDLEERRVGEPRQPARDLRLAAAGRPDHQDVLGRHLLAQRPVELLPPPAVAQRDGDGALGVVLADDVAVEFGDDFAGRKGVMMCLGLIVVGGPGMPARQGYVSSSVSMTTLPFV